MEDGLECEVCVDGIRLEHVSEFKYLGCVLDKFGTDGAECSRKVASGRRVAGAIRSLVNASALLVPVLVHDSERMLWKEEDWLKYNK